jgi:hypothetical protein
MCPIKGHMKFKTGTLNVTRQYTCRKISPSFVGLQIHTLAASQPRYREGGEAIAHKAFHPPHALPSSLPSYCGVAQACRYLVFSVHKYIFDCGNVRHSSGFTVEQIGLSSQRREPDRHATAATIHYISSTHRFKLHIKYGLHWTERNQNRFAIKLVMSNYLCGIIKLALSNTSQQETILKFYKVLAVPHLLFSSEFWTSTKQRLQQI